MASREAEEKIFIEYLEKLMDGQPLHPEAGLSKDMLADLEFARNMLVSREEASPAFKYWLKVRLLQKLRAESEAGTIEKQGWYNWFHKHRSMAIAGLVGLAVLIVVTAVIWKAMPSIVPLPSSQYAVNLPASNTPEKFLISSQVEFSTASGNVMVYALKPADTSSERLNRIAEKLGLSGARVLNQDDTKIVVTDKADGTDRQITVWKATGAVEYTMTSVSTAKTGVTSKLPLASEAKRIGYDKLSSTGLLPPGYGSFNAMENIIKVVPGDSYPVLSKTGQAESSPARYWIVEFPTIINGVEATGPGARMEVSVGEDDKVINLQSYWRELEPRYRGNVISAENAYDKLVQGNGSLEIPFNTSQVIVKQVALKYWIDPPSVDQELSLPVYEFEGECLDKSGKTIEKFTAWTSAIH